MISPIYAELSLQEHLRRQLSEQYPQTDEETLSDTVEGLTYLTNKPSVITGSMLNDRTLATGIRHRITDMHGRLKRIESRAEKKKDLVTTVMERAKLKKFIDPEFTISLRASAPNLVILDEKTTPKMYWKPQPPKLNRQSILDDLRYGKELPGAALDNSAPTISIRTKCCLSPTRRHTN
jgi:hypothetical protein